MAAGQRHLHFWLKDMMLFLCTITDVGVVKALFGGF